MHARTHAHTHKQPLSLGLLDWSCVETQTPSCFSCLASKHQHRDTSDSVTNPPRQRRAIQDDTSVATTRHTARTSAHGVMPPHHTADPRRSASTSHCQHVFAHAALTRHSTQEDAAAHNCHYSLVSDTSSVQTHVRSSDSYGCVSSEAKTSFLSCTTKAASETPYDVRPATLTRLVLGCKATCTISTKSRPSAFNTRLNGQHPQIKGWSGIMRYDKDQQIIKVTKTTQVGKRCSNKARELWPRTSGGGQRALERSLLIGSIRQALGFDWTTKLELARRQRRK